MIKISFSRVCLQILMVFLTVSTGFSQTESEEGHVKVTMRMVGHQLLQASGDSTSIVLPIEKIEKRYRIQFQSGFQFVPQELIGVIDTVVKKAHIAKKYLVEFEDCDSNKVVYSYEIGPFLDSNIIPCLTRDSDMACYQIYFTILTPYEIEEKIAENKVETEEGGAFDMWILIGVILFILMLVLLYKFKKKKKSVEDPDLIYIGNFQFDKRNMELIFKDDITELTSKESDLLILLFTSVNTTVEKDNILREVWGDDGDYIGRTLDVFISKLRKKLEKDPNLKIVNVRGVGYKLIVNINRSSK